MNYGDMNYHMITIIPLLYHQKYYTIWSVVLAKHNSYHHYTSLYHYYIPRLSPLICHYPLQKPSAAASAAGSPGVFGPGVEAWHIPNFDHIMIVVIIMYIYNHQNSFNDDNDDDDYYYYYYYCYYFDDTKDNNQ